MKSDPICLILCGGKGSRMNSPTLHKVCFEIGGKPAIQRTLAALSEAGLSRFVVVLGSMPEQVMQCIEAAYDGVTYAFQREPLGTGDAVQTGLRTIRRMGIDGPVMVVMGDKIISPNVARTMLCEFWESSADAVFAVQPYDQHPSGGRIAFDDAGAVQGIVEAKDLEAALADGRPIGVGEVEYPATRVAQGRYVNAAVYLFKQPPLVEMLGKLSKDNAQGELYLTDVIGLLSNAGRSLRTVPVDDERELLTFNTVEELLEVERAILGEPEVHLSPTRWKSVSEWRECFQEPPERLRDVFQDVYGDDDALIQERRRDYGAALEHFARRFGEDRKVVLTRAPGRVNLMGRHVEHRGGWVNVISINKEVVCVAARRDDDLVRITNVDESFPDQEFRIGDHFMRMDWQSWTDYLDAKETQALVYGAKGNWGNYVKAAILRLQYNCKDRPLKGMDMAFCGSVPMAAGLSSSSAVVVATAEAAIEANGLDLEPQDFVDLCGEGEWYVGSRGGAGDHAAMKYGNRGNIARLGFFPFRFEGLVPFPEGYKLVIANSFVQAQKTTNAKDVFNERIASYEFGLFYFWEVYPELKDRIQRLRDINPETLEVPPSSIYEMLQKIPERASLEEIRAFLPSSYEERIDTIAATHSVPDDYPLRAVLLYGIAECMRSSRAQRLLEAGDIEGFGRLMNVSHDGDRVVRNANGEALSFDSTLSDHRLRELVEDLRSEDPPRVLRAQLEHQPGGYACSTPETDLLVDTALSVPGVAGAQLSGAGLGGCVMVLVREDAVDALTEALMRSYYDPRGLESGITVCVPVKGSMVWEIADAEVRAAPRRQRQPALY